MQPQSRAVAMARAARLAAPRAEAALPPRSLVAAITGADSGVLIVGGQRVQAPDQQRFPLDLRVPEPRALLLVPVDAFLHRVDIDERQHIRAGQQRRLPRPAPPGTPGPPSPAGDVAPGIRAQVRAQRGRGADPAEQDVHRAVPQQVHVIDAVGARGHARDQARDFQVRVDPALAARRDVLRDQARRARPAAASAITGTRPACDTRFGSSKDACVFARLWNEGYSGDRGVM